MSKNTNCLKGKACPNCGHDEEVVVSANMRVSLTDEGADPHADSTKTDGDIEYDGDSFAKCPKCKYFGRFETWDIPEEVSPKTQVCEFVDGSDLLPNDWGLWFWTALRDTDAEFDWGRNNKSLVCASDFRDAAAEAINHHLGSPFDRPEYEITREEADAFLAKLEKLGTTYIDLEN